ncbi:uncharacterized protein LOC124683987 [Lolium rigidum]|uniref:uncharacterized protein LOC124683987 n=1 Tax=Lolium rigidum TaxID=89674 RepID=UPI001F5E34F6|nr:uncharacterized protein LOC124683987 [Lolium rigidum]
MGEHAYDHISSMSPSTPPAQHRGSTRHERTVPSRNTTRPAIRIIHIIPPEIIETDAANFRDLVQRLTGRQHQQLAYEEASTAVTVAAAPTRPSPVEEKPQKKRLAPAATALADDCVLPQENTGRKKIKCEVVKVEEGEFGFGGVAGAGDLDFGELWMDLNPEGFLSFLEEDVFQWTMAPEFSQPPLGSSSKDLIGEMCASFLA